MDSTTAETTYTQGQLEQLARDALDRAKRLGASQAEVGLGVASGFSVAVRLGEVDKLEYQRDRGLTVTVYFGKRKGTASTADLSPRAVGDIVASACSIAHYTGEDHYAGLAEAALMAAEIPDLDLCHPWQLEPQHAIELAGACEDAARAFDARITNSEGADVASERSLHVYANSHGFAGGVETTSHSISCAVLGRDGDSANMQRDHWYSVARDANELESPEAVGRKAGERTIKRLGARRLRTRKAPVMYIPDVARGLIGHFLRAIRGASQYREASFLLNATGERVFPEFVRISERPHIPKAWGSAAFDGEGVATVDRELITAGVLQGYLLDSYAARKLGLTTTGHAGGVHNIIVQPGDKDFPQMLEMMGTGFLVCELMGQGVNGVTGDYSRGASGFWVENGEIAYPVEEVTIAGNLRDMLNGVRAMGNDVDQRGNIRVGSVLIGELTIGGE